MSRKFEILERINPIRETNGSFDSVTHVNGWTSRLHELHELKLPFVSRIEFNRSKISNFSAHVSGITGGPMAADPTRALGSGWNGVSSVIDKGPNLYVKSLAACYQVFQTWCACLVKW